MSKKQRDKGHNFEREIARRLRPLFPEAARGFQTRGGTSDEPDVDHTPWYIECKVGARPNIIAAYEQAKAASDGRPPLVVSKKDRHDVLVTMSFDTFYALIERLR